MDLTRVTQSTIAAASMAGLQDNLSRVQQLQEELSSGYRVSRPSDSPADAVSAMSYRADIRRTQQYQSNVNDGLSYLGTTDSTLQSMLTYVQRARNLVLQGANSNLSTQDRAALANEIDGIRSGLLSSANTQYLGKAIFGGTSAAAQAYSPAGAYLGDSGALSRTVAPGTSVQISLTGPQVFGTSPASVFDVLSQISSDLRNTTITTNLSGADLTNLDAASATINGALATVGTRYNQLQSAKTSNDTQLGALQTGLSRAEDIDLPKTISDLQLQQVAYQASLAATAKVIQPSLLDFLK